MVRARPWHLCGRVSNYFYHLFYWRVSAAGDVNTRAVLRTRRPTMLSICRWVTGADMFTGVGFFGPELSRLTIHRSPSPAVRYLTTGADCVTGSPNAVVRLLQTH